MGSQIWPLRRVIHGKDWLHFTSTCKSLRMYTWHNRKLTVVWKGQKSAFPPGTSGVWVTRTSLRRLGEIPSKAKYLVIEKEFIHQTKVKIPDHISSLWVKGEIMEELPGALILPANLKKLRVETFWIDSNIPIRLHSLKVDGFISWISGSLPRTLTYLDMGDGTDISPDTFNLPDTLETLIFGGDFWGPLDEWTAPKNLVTLATGRRFNSPVHRWCLPETLECLVFGQRFNASIDQLRLPPGLKVLMFDENFRQDFHTALPTGLKVIQVLYPFFDTRSLSGSSLELLVVHQQQFHVSKGLAKTVVARMCSSNPDELTPWYKRYRL